MTAPGAADAGSAPGVWASQLAVAGPDAGRASDGPVTVRADPGLQIRTMAEDPSRRAFAWLPRHCDSEISQCRGLPGRQFAASTRKRRAISGTDRIPTDATGSGVRAVDQAAAFTSIFFGSATAAEFFGRLKVKTPLLNSALILSRSTPSGRVKVR